MSDSTLLYLNCTQDHFEDDWKDKYEIREFSLIKEAHGEKIHWKKNVTPKPSYSAASPLLNVIDSTLYFFKTDGWDKKIRIDQITALKLGDVQQSKDVKLEYKKIELEGEGWNSRTNVGVRPWKNGLILVNSRYWDGIGSGNHYALLDTTAGTMKLWEPTGEFEWLKDCLDVKWSSIGGLCLKQIPDTLGFVLLRNGVDTLAVRYDKASTISGTSLGFDGNGIRSNGWVYLMDKQGQISDKPLDFWILYD